MSNKCYIGMSGGVDSSVAAYILKEQGYDLKGVYANCFYDDDQCRNSDDHKDAVRVATGLGIVLDTKDYREAYKQNVLDYFYSEYSNGRTPNPDILCNSEIKFGVMASDIFDQGWDVRLATGHYVGVKALSMNEFSALFDHINKQSNSINKILGLIYGNSNGLRHFLISGKDVTKDQSYFLYRLYDKTENLNRYVFPLSEMSKKEVRNMAKHLKLDIASKPDSQGICFIGDVKIKEFIADHVKSMPGKVVNIKGEVVGSHSGIQFYTIGQRHGFTISKYSGRPYYIVEKILDKNLLVVGSREEASAKKFKISDLSFPYNIENFLEEFNELGLTVRIRNLGKKIPCKVKKLESQKYEVELLEPEFGVAPGQSSVFYIDRLMLGGGIIE